MIYFSSRQIFSNVFRVSIHISNYTFHTLFARLFISIMSDSSMSFTSGDESGNDGIRRRQRKKSKRVEDREAARRRKVQAIQNDVDVTKKVLQQTAQSLVSRDIKSVQEKTAEINRMSEKFQEKATELKVASEKLSWWRCVYYSATFITACYLLFRAISIVVSTVSIRSY